MQFETNSRFDYIIIGAGTSGSVIAGRLSENPHVSVLLLEAGGLAALVPPIWIPSDNQQLYGIEKIQWGYEMVAQPNLNNRTISYARGKVTGGCSAVNDMVFAYGARADFDNWSTNDGCTGWDYDSISPYFEKVNQTVPPLYRQADDWSHDFVKVCTDELGLPFVPNYNSGTSMRGISQAQASVDSHNRRMTAFSRYVTPYLASRPNLITAEYCHVDQILFDDTLRAISVTLESEGAKFTIHANNEIILSAGAINSPAILMRSGIGDADTLKNLGIKVVKDMPAVGQNMMEAVIFNCNWKTTRRITYQPTNLAFPIVWDNMTAQDQPLNCCETSRGLYQANQTQDDLELHYTITGGGMGQKSLGTVTLASSNPAQAPIINANLLSAEGDFQQCREAFQLVRKIGNSPSLLKAWGAIEINPGPSINTQEQIDEWLKDNIWPYGHATGTCRMGGNRNNTVVDPSLKVWDVQGLRIADASIMPHITHAHTQIPSYMIGEKAAAMIRGLGTT